SFNCGLHIAPAERFRQVPENQKVSKYETLKSRRHSMDTVDPRPSDPIVVQGTAGRVLFTRMACRLVSHVHREHQVIFHCGGAAAVFRVNGALQALRSGEMILVNPWQSHEMLANPEGASVLLSVLFDPAETGGGARTGVGAFREVHRAVPRPLHCALDATV